MEKLMRLRNRLLKRKFRMKDHLAYTEDNVKIHNIFVTNIPRRLTQAKIRDHFKKFGKIVKITYYWRIYKCGPNQTPTRVVVKYSNPSSATKALLEQNHVLHCKRLKVEPCDSWRQPSNVYIERCLSESGMNNEHIFSLLANLNEDCLYHIYQYIPISKQAFFAKTSVHANNVFHRYSKIKYKTLKLNILTEMTAWEQYEFLEAVGEYVTRLYGFRTGKVSSRLIEFIGQYCINIDALESYETYIKSPDMSSLLTKLTKLKKLRLDSCMLCTGALSKIGKLPNLQSLDLTGNPYISGAYISAVTTLNYLNLSNCDDVTLDNLLLIFTSLPNLKYLNLSRVVIRSYPQFLYQLLAKTCVEILVIHIDNDAYEFLAQMPELMKLQITTTIANRLKEEFITTLVTRAATRLKSLWIDFRFILSNKIVEGISQLVGLEFLSIRRNLNDTSILFLRNLKNLKYLDISETVNITPYNLCELIKSLPNLLELDLQYCNHIDTSFVIALIRFFEYNVHERKEPLTIYVAFNRSEIMDLNEIYSTYKILPKKEYVKLDFTYHARVDNLLDSVSPFGKWVSEL